MSTKPTADASLPIRYAPRAYCPRKLKPGWVKRYMSSGPLVGYMIACPSCGFCEMHMRAGYTEEPATDLTSEPYEVASNGMEKGSREPVPQRLVRLDPPVTCILCHRFITVVDGHVVAQRSKPAATT